MISNTARADHTNREILAHPNYRELDNRTVAVKNKSAGMRKRDLVR